MIATHTHKLAFALCFLAFWHMVDRIIAGLAVCSLNGPHLECGSWL